MKLNATQLLEKTIEANSSDLHVVVGAKPFLRINTKLTPMEEMPVFTVDDVEFFLSQILDQDQRQILEVNKELDFSISLGAKSRFRVNAFYQKGYPSVALRVIPMVIPSIDTLGLPANFNNICDLKQGLVMVVGPTGQGKSTTIASMIDRINESRAEHIVTIEDPIEYVFTNKKSLVEQREMFLDTHSWDVALKSILRQDPNVVLIGEMRDMETMSAALQISETGHLVFATLHTTSASNTIERIIASFPESKRAEVRVQLAQVIEVVISQRLLPSEKKGMIPAVEIMLGTDAVKNIVREGKTHMLDNIINTSSQIGMISLERSLAILVSNGFADYDIAVKYTSKPDELKRLLDLGSKGKL
ncbi:PilT/PilU family type 4a pilus ATPase [candidate division WWE3 bacterium]|jgi:twitching motility protein PilT|uniref:PilT/PilU family type 4a pilus ATPase n=1 Tax=candidate division WWE3 bacterium TaxID=2053526 RepID=A0A3A4ZIF8_UNCKA|nr:MAG: PilT/PilU family type 4a pilus ATPase [candidate division WWE3 bacterium]